MCYSGGSAVKASILNKVLLTGICSTLCFMLMGLIGKRRNNKEVSGNPEIIFPSI